MRVSASQLKTWGECALRGKFIYVDKINRYTTGSSAMLGTAAHLGFEELTNGATLDGALEAFREYYEDPKNEPDYYNTRTTYLGLKNKGIEMITNFDEFLREHPNIVTVGSEISFRVPFGDHLISGFVDWLYYDPDTNTLYIVDHKTGKRPDNDGLRMNIQMTTYGWAVNRKEFWVGYIDPDTGEKYGGIELGEELYEKLKDAPRKFIWYDHKNGKPYDAGPREAIDYRRLYRLVEMVQRAIETDTFVPTINGDNCLWCFAGDTRYLTRSGWKTFEETVGTTQTIRGKNGAWIDAPVRSYGVAPLWKITLSRGRGRKEIFATGNHRWFIDNHKAHPGNILETQQLKPGMMLLSSFGSGIGNPNPMLHGIQAGLVYGDGHKVRGGQNGAAITLYGEKNINLLSLFPGLPSLKGTYDGLDTVTVSGMPSYFKDPVPIHESPAYLKGWLMGYFASDGTITKSGQCSISSASRASLELVQDVCGVLGLGTSDIHVHHRLGKGAVETPLYKIYLHGHMLDEEFFLVSMHKNRFVEKDDWRPLKGWKVLSIEKSDRTEEVYCVDVPDFDRFIIEGNILTHNCDFKDICPVFIPGELDTSIEL